MIFHYNYVFRYKSVSSHCVFTLSLPASSSCVSPGSRSLHLVLFNNVSLHYKIMSIIFAGPGFEILEYELVSIELMILLP